MEPITAAIIERLIVRFVFAGTAMPTTDNIRPRTWLTSVLTDVHFWVPVAVLIGGLLLLESIR
jgi:hypothetical protein